MMIFVVLGAGIGMAAAVLATSLIPRRPTVAETLDALRRPPSPALTRTARAQAAVAGPLYLLRLPTPRTRTDLAILDRDPTAFLASQCGLTMLGLLAPAATVASLNAMGAGIGWTVPLWAGLLTGAGGYLAAHASIREQARARRLLMRHTLAALLDVIPTALAAGAGIEQAMTSATRSGTGWAAQSIRRALEVARDNHQPIAQALKELGQQTGVVELEQLAGSLHLAAGEGSRIRQALTHRGEAISRRLTADLVAEAEAATERMAIPLMGLAMVFLLALVYPTLAAFQA